MNRPLNKREQKKLIRKATEAKNKRMYILFIIAFFSSFVLLLYSWVQYHWTIIDYKIPLAIFIIAGLLLGGFIKKYFKNVLERNRANVHIFWFVVMAGSIVTALFFLLNNIFSKDQMYSIRAPIVDSHKTRSKGGSISIQVEVKMVNFTKGLAFPDEDEEKLLASNFVLLDVSKGGLGFEIIRNRTLVK